MISLGCIKHIHLVGVVNRLHDQIHSLVSLTCSFDGRWTVFAPALPMNLLIKRVLANVPRDMIASLPRRDPYELN